MAKSPGKQPSRGRGKRTATGQLVPQVAYSSMGAESLATGPSHRRGFAMATGRAELTVTPGPGTMAVIGATPEITILPPDWEQLSGLLTQIGADIRSLVPSLHAIVEAQQKLGGNAAKFTTLLPDDAARIAELTAGILSEQAKATNPHLSVIEHCLRGGRWLLQQAWNVITNVGSNLAVAYALLPDETSARIHAIVLTIEHVLGKLFG